MKYEYVSKYMRNSVRHVEKVSGTTRCWYLLEEGLEEASLHSGAEHEVTETDVGADRGRGATSSDPFVKRGVPGTQTLLLMTAGQHSSSRPARGGAGHTVT